MADTKTERVPERTLPKDEYSTALRSLTGNPGAVRTQSRVDIEDLYGESVTWVIDTFRVEGGHETTLVQRIDNQGGLRLVLPPAVTAAMARQRDRATTVNRKRAARRGVETRIARGDTLGNPSALRAARKAKTARRKK